MNIGQAIVTIRKARKMTQKELAERCGMSQNALVAIEKNRSQPPMETMKRLQEALGVPQSYILLYSIEDCAKYCGGTVEFSYSDMYRIPVSDAIYKTKILGKNK